MLLKQPASEEFPERQLDISDTTVKQQRTRHQQTLIMLTALNRRLLGAAGTGASVIGSKFSSFGGTSTSTPVALLRAGAVAAYHGSSRLSLPEKSKPPVVDPAIQKLIHDNRQWVETKNQEDPEFFKALGKGQEPDFLYIGCSDSRVSISSLTGLDLGHVFVHRNIANMVGKCYSSKRCA